MKEDGRMGRVLAWLEPRAPGLHRFLVREERPFPALREGLAIALFLSLLAAVLWGATGQAFPTESPVVVVESESMMHCQPPYTAGGVNCQRPPGVAYGRFGTIDPGDLIFVRDTDSRTDVETWAEAVGSCAGRHTDFQGALDCGCDGRDGYGACGDVIIFRKSSADATPVIHRALFWLEVHGDGTYSVDLPESWGCTDLDRVPLRASSSDGHAEPNSGLDRSPCLTRLGAASFSPRLDELGPEGSGFITRGDNNQYADQSAQSNVEAFPVRPEQLLGKARAELPWLGLVKLFATDVFLSGTDNYRQAPNDAKVLMWLTLGTIIATPGILEAAGRLRRR